MWKKPTLCGVIIALGGAIAIVGAQERSQPATLIPPQSARQLVPPSGQLSEELQSVQQEVVNEYANRGEGQGQRPLPGRRTATRVLRPGAESTTELPSRRWRSQEVTPASYGEPASSRSSFEANPYIDGDSGDEPEVPSILSGNRPRRNQPATQPPAATGSEGVEVTSPGASPRVLNPAATGSLSDASSSAAPSRPQAAPGLPRQVQPGQVESRPLPTQIGSRAPTETPAQEPLLNATQGSPSDAVAEERRVASNPNVSNPAISNPAIPNPNATQSSNTSPTRSASVARISMDSVGAQLRITGEGPSILKVGKPASYKIQARNISNVEAKDAIVKLRLPAWVSLIDASSSVGTIDRTTEGGERVIEWNITTIPSTSLQELNLQVVVKENRPFDMSTEWSTAPIYTTNRIQVTQPKLEVAVNGPAEIVYGQKTVLNISVANSGNGAAENVIVTLPEEIGGQRTVLGTIPAGGIESVQVELTARKQGSMQVTANVAADGDISQIGEHRIMVRRASLEVDVQAPQFKFAGSVAEVKIIVQNVGDAPANSVIAAAALPVGAKYEGGITTAEPVDGGIKWEVGELAPGARMQYSVLCSLNEAGNAHFEAGVRDSTQLGAADSADTRVETVAELVLEVKDPKGPIPVNEEVIYELTVRNRGTKIANGVNLIAQFSEGIDPTEGVGMESTIADGQVVFETIPTMRPGQEIVLRVKAKAGAAGNHVFRAHLTCADPDTHRVFEGTTRYFDARGLGDSTGSSLNQIEPLRRGGATPTPTAPESTEQPTPATQPALTFPR